MNKLRQGLDWLFGWWVVEWYVDKGNCQVYRTRKNPRWLVELVKMRVSWAIWTRFRVWIPL